jgi:hypothetical protein
LEGGGGRPGLWGPRSNARPARQSTPRTLAAALHLLVSKIKPCMSKIPAVPGHTHQFARWRWRVGGCVWGRPRADGPRVACEAPATAGSHRRVRARRGHLSASPSRSRRDKQGGPLCMANPAPPENFLGQRRAAHLPPAVGGWRAPAGPRGQGGASAPGLPEGWARRPVGGGGGPPGEETAAGCRRQEARGGRAGWMARRAPAPREALNLPVHEAGPTRADPVPPARAPRGGLAPRTCLAGPSRGRDISRHQPPLLHVDWDPERACEARTQGGSTLATGRFLMSLPFPAQGLAFGTLLLPREEPPA